MPVSPFPRDRQTIFSSKYPPVLPRQKIQKIFKTPLTNLESCYIIHKLSPRQARTNEHAAIAQPVERILGKDEVASSNLASSSKKALEPQRFWGFCFFAENLTAKKTTTKTTT